MATYQVVDAEQLNAGLTEIGDAIRAKAGTSGALAFPSAMAEAIANIPSGGGIPLETSAVTFTYNDTSNIYVTYTGLSESGEPCLCVEKLPLGVATTLNIVKRTAFHVTASSQIIGTRVSSGIEYKWASNVHDYGYILRADASSAETVYADDD